MPAPLASTMYFLVCSSPYTVGKVSPARGATSMNVTDHGRPENLGRGAGFTPRVDMPCASKRDTPPRSRPPEAADWRNRRRVKVILEVGYLASTNLTPMAVAAF